MAGRVARSGLGRHRRCPGICAAFFDLSWAYWLKDLIPGASEVIEIDGGRLFFPDERPAISSMRSESTGSRAQRQGRGF
jgi:hypothetical protein